MIDLRELAALAGRYADDLDHPVAPFRLGEVDLDTDARTALMGVVNLSPDSWYRESVAVTTESAVRLGRVLAAQGADVVDVGAESVVTSADRVGAHEQRRRLVPVVDALVGAGVPVSVESYHASVVEPCLAAGAAVLNLTGSADDAEMFALAAAHGASVVLCHVGGDTPRDLDDPDRRTAESDPVPGMREQFSARIEHARRLGVPSVSIDPGVGFPMPWLRTSIHRARYQAAMLAQSFRLRSLGVPVCHALPATIDLFGPEVRSAEGFFAVLASLGGTGILRTHEIPRVRAVLAAMHTLAVEVEDA